MNRRGRTWRASVAVCALLSVLAGAGQAASLAPVSRTATNLPNDAGNAGSAASGAAVSADGCRAAFSSAATNLVPGQLDLNGVEDVFLHDCADGSLSLLSVSAGTATTTADRGASEPVISADGRYIAFRSASRDLVAGLVKEHGEQDLYLYDSNDGSLALVNASPMDPAATTELGAGFAAFSADSAWLLFASAASDVLPEISDNNGGFDLFQLELASGAKTLVTRKSDSCFFLFSACTANAGSLQGSMSADGRYVVFTSSATNLSIGQSDTASTNDVFVWDRQSGSIVLVSHVDGAATTAAGARSENPSISADGAWLAYTSHASAIIAGATDVNGDSDVFLFERATGGNTLVSHLPAQPTVTDDDGWSGNPTLNADGSLVAFTSVSQDLVVAQVDGSPLSDDLFLYDRATGVVSLVSHEAGAPTTTASGSTVFARFSADGAYIVFVSRAANLVAGQIDGNDFGDSLMGEDVYRHELATGTTLLLSHAPGAPAQAGRFMSFTATTDATAANVVFVSDADDLLTLADGNDARDIYRWSAADGAVTLLSRREAAADPVGLIGASQAVVSADGRWVAFTSEARNAYPGLVDDDSDNTGYGRDDDVFLLDRDSGEVILVSRSAAGADVTSENDSNAPRISGDGRYVVFLSASVDSVDNQIDGNGAFDVFLFDRTTRSLVLVSHQAVNPQQTGNGASGPAEISRDGTHVVFTSTASDLIAGGTDANGAADVFLYEIASGSLQLVSRSTAAATTAGNGDARAPSISGNGQYVAFESQATNHISGMDFNSARDVFLFDAATGTNRLVSRQGSSATSSGSAASFKPRLSADGQFVAFLSEADNLLPFFMIDGNSGADVFVFDRTAGFAPTALVSRIPGEDAASGDGACTDLSISDDGGRIAFLCTATNLVEGQQDSPFTDDLFVFERLDGSTRLVSTSAYNEGMAVGAEQAVIAGDGSAVLFESRSFEVVEGLAEATGQLQAYLHLVDAGASVMLSRSLRGPEYPSASYAQIGAITPDGAVSLFFSPSPDIVSYDGNRAFPGESGIDAFAFERALGIPVVTAPGDQAVLEDESTGTLAFSLSDPDGPVAQLQLSARSSDELVVPRGNIVFGGTSEAPTVEITPAQEQSGSALITLRATDSDGNVGVASFTLVVDVVNDVPQLALPASTAVLEDQNTGLLDFFVDDPDHAEDDLLFTVSSSDTGIVPNNAIALAGSGENRRLRVTPAPDRFGIVTITVLAEDPDGAIGQSSFELDVQNVNDAPSFVPGGNVDSDEDVPTEFAGWATLVSAGPFESAQGLTFEVVDNSAPSLFASGPAVGTDGTLHYTPALDASGTATITLRLRDDGGVAHGGDDTSGTQLFDIAIAAVNDAPTITGAASVQLDEDGSLDVALTLADLEDAAADLNVQVDASDYVLLPPGDQLVTGTGASRSLAVLPGKDANGTGYLEVTVTDTGGESSTLVLSVDVLATDELVDLIAALDNGVDFLAVGSTSTWVATIDNAGDDTAYAVDVLDNAPAGVLDIGWTCSAIDGASCASTAGTGPVSLQVTVPPLGQAIIEITATVSGDAAPVLDYAIDAAVGADTQEASPADNIAVDTDQVGEPVFGDGFEG